MEFRLPEKFSGQVVDRYQINDKSYLRLLTAEKKLFCVPEREGTEKYLGKTVFVEHKEGQLNLSSARHAPQREARTGATREIERF